MDPVNDLYARPLEEFTASRNQLAADTRKAGDREAAAAILKLRKPSVTLWAVNRMARVEGGLVAAVVEAAEGMRKAQESALRGRGGGPFREASAALQRALDGAVKAAAAGLVNSGHAASEDALRRIREVLMAAAMDPAAVAALQAGCLREEPGSPALAGFGDPPPRIPELVDRPADIARAEADRKARAVESRERAGADRVAADRAAHRAAELTDLADDLQREARAARAAAEAADRDARAAEKTARRSASEADTLERVGGGAPDRH